MPWLVVLGAGSWSPFKGTRYPAGKHKVDAETAAKARTSGLKQLLVLDDEPDISDGVKQGGPLSADDIKTGVRRGIHLSLAPPPLELDEADLEIPMNYPCEWCPAKFPTAPPLARHVEMHHSAG